MPGNDPAGDDRTDGTRPDSSRMVAEETERTQERRGVICMDCRDPAHFWVYSPDVAGWRPYCERHTIDIHPSLEVKAWLESGYAKPVELGDPPSTPTPPPTPRSEAFRDIVRDAMGWTGDDQY